MSADRLKNIMAEEDKRVIDMASELHISPSTVAKYLKGERVSRAIQQLIEHYIASKSNSHPAGRKTAAG